MNAEPVVESEQANAEPDFLPNLMRCLLWHWGTTDPDLLNEIWDERKPPVAVPSEPRRA